MRLSFTFLIVGFLLFSCSSPHVVSHPLSSQPQLSPEAQRLITRADSLYREGKFIEAAQTGEFALKVNQTSLPTNIVDATILQIAELYTRGDSPTDAIRVLRSLLQHPPASPEERPYHGQASYRLAMLLYKSSQLEEALIHASAAEEIAREMDNPSALFDILTLVSVIEHDLDHPLAEISALTESLAILPRLDPPRPRARLLILGLLVHAYRSHKRYPEAEDAALEHLKEAEKLDDLDSQIKALFLQGTLKVDQGKSQEAVDAFLDAARKASEKPDREKAMQHLKYAIAILEELKDYDQIKDILLVALNRYDEVFNDKKGKADLKLLLGGTLVQLGMYDSAQGYLLDAYMLYKQVNDNTEAARALVGLGEMSLSLSDYRNAFRYFAAAQRHASEAKDADALGKAHKQLGRLYARYGWYLDAFREYEEARKLYDSLERYDLVFSVEFLIGALFQDMGEKDKLREQVSHLEQYRTRLPSLNEDFLYWLGLSQFYQNLGEEEKIKEYGSRALEVARKSNDTVGQVDSLRWLALFTSPHERIALLQEAYSIAKKERMLRRYHSISSSLGLAFLENKMIEEALRTLSTSIEETEGMIHRISFSETRISFAEGELDGYSGLIETLYVLYEKDGDSDLAEKALRVHERSRAREFARKLTERRIEAIGEKLPNHLYTEERVLAGGIDELEREIFKLSYAYQRDERLLQRKEKELEAKRERYTKLIRAIQGRYPEYVTAKRRDLGSVRGLPIRADEAVLIYRIAPAPFLGASTGVFVWILTASQSGTEIRSFKRINEDIQVLASKSVAGFMKDEPHSPPQEALEVLSEKLLKPFLGTLTGVSKLTVIRDGPLEFLPFEILPVGTGSESLVVDRWVVGYYPSLLSMVISRSATSPKNEKGESALLVGNPQYVRTSDSTLGSGETSGLVRLRSGGTLDELRYSAIEIRKIDELFKSNDISTTVLMRASAAEGRIKQLDLRKYRYLHFAVHGLQPHEVLGVGEPSLAFSAIDRDENGFLTTSEVMGLQLKAQLVILSACRTALGAYYRGEGFENLARAFLAAGTESVVVSQWAVADQSTSELMVELYTNLTQGMSVPEALRAAKISLRERYPSPYYWAPFILVGG